MKKELNEWVIATLGVLLGPVAFFCFFYFGVNNPESILLVLAPLVPIILIIIIPILVDKFKSFRLSYIDFEYIDIKKIKPSMELPKFMDIDLAYYIGGHVWIIQDKRIIVQTYILKWIQEGYLTQIKDLDSPSKFKLLLTKEVKTNNIVEKELFEIIKEMATDKNIITNNTMEDWILNNKERMREWFELLYKSCYYRLTGKADGMYCYDFNAGESLVKYAKQLMALKKWLSKYSVMEERQPMEVKLWNEYMLYASLFGITDKVEKNLASICPESINYDRKNGIDALREIGIVFKIVKVNVKKMFKVE